MRSLISFELFKLFKRRKNIAGIVALIVLILIYIFTSIGMEKSRYATDISLCKDDIQSNESMIKSTDTPKETVKLLSKHVSLVKTELKALDNGDWKTFLKAKIQDNNNKISEINNDSLISGDNPDELKAENRKYQYLLNNNIKPIYENCNTQAFNFLKNVLTDIMPIIMLILLFLISADIVSNEAEGGSLRLLLVQPVSRSKIIFSKFAASVIYCFSVIIFIFGTFFVILGLTRGFGSAYYPISFNNNCFLTFFNARDVSVSIIPLYAFLLLSVPILILLIIATVSFSLLFSTIFNSSATSISLLIILTVAVYVFLNRFNILKPAAPILFFLYTNIPGLLDGTISKSMHLNSITYTSGVIVFILYTIICYATSSFIFNKKDIH